MNFRKRAEKIVLSDESKEEKVKLLCDVVREIPYKRIGSLDPEGMIKAGMGSCTPKHVFLASYFEKLNIQVKFLIIPFFYKKMSIKYPKDKINIVNKMPITYHTALKINLDKKWIVIDVTWDSALQKMGFVVNNNWDGKSNMKLCVVPEDIIEKDVDPTEFEKSELKKYTQEEKVARKNFYDVFDQILENSRKGKLQFNFNKQ